MHDLDIMRVGNYLDKEYGKSLSKMSLEEVRDIALEAFPISLDENDVSLEDVALLVEYVVMD